MRLIDADALTRHKQLEAMGNGKYEDVEVVYANDIDNAPTIDAVPVVRCKDCKWWTEWANGTGSCNRFTLDWIGTDADDFCSMGEKRR